MQRQGKQESRGQPHVLKFFTDMVLPVRAMTQ